mmetsp:Transcript_28693/g.66167  ORF Transcript_28693/g.66167 Transcript_28693/m.66167 type:complete len:592 (+) Transcript_28693:79-1854(+)
MGGQRADGLIMDWKAVSQEPGPAGLSSTKLGSIDGGWVIRELDVQTSKSRLKKSTSTGKAFRFRSLSPGAPPSPTCVPSSPRSNATGSPPREGQLGGLFAGATADSSRQNSPKSSPMRHVHARAIASSTLPQDPSEQASAPNVSALGMDFRRWYDGGLLPVHLIKKPDGSPARLIWTVDLEDVSLQRYLPLFVDGLREKEDPYCFVAFEGTTSLLACSGHKVLPVVPELISSMKVALNSNDSQVVMAIMRVLQQLLVVGVPSELLTEAQHAVVAARKRSPSPDRRRLLDESSADLKTTKLQAAQSPDWSEVSMKSEPNAEANDDPTGDALQCRSPPALGENPWRWGVSQRTAELGADRLFPFHLMTPHALTKSSQEEADSPRTHLANVSAALEGQLLSLEKMSAGKSATRTEDAVTPQKKGQSLGKDAPKSPSPSMKNENQSAQSPNLRQTKAPVRLSPHSRQTGNPSASSQRSRKAPSPPPRPSPASSPGTACRDPLPSSHASVHRASPSSSRSPAHRAARLDSRVATKKNSNSDAVARLSTLGDKLEKSLQLAERSVMEDLQLLDRRRNILRWAASLPVQSVLEDQGTQ